MSDRIARRGLMLVLSSPSGAGKTTLSRMLLEADRELEMSVSVTSRPPRPGEIDGKDYRFVDETEFRRMQDDGELLEWAKVFGNYYGTPKEPVESALGSGCDILFDIDWQGTQQLQQKAKSDLVRVFILPPSAEALEERLKTRAQDPPDVVAGRMDAASGEISHWAEYDYVVINQDKTSALAQIKVILAAERLKRERRVGLTEFVRKLQANL
ncbi:MAG: guanylate kinase [Hyphomicrobiales bacterium]|nr:guanylate kinase [Hyphomicrobiales bacterium]